MQKIIKFRDDYWFIHYVMDEEKISNVLVMKALGSLRSNGVEFKELIGKSMTIKKIYWTESDYKEVADKNKIQDNNRLTDIYPLDNYIVSSRQDFIRQLKKRKPFDIEIIIEEANNG